MLISILPYSEHFEKQARNSKASDFRSFVTIACTFRNLFFRCSTSFSFFFVSIFFLIFALCISFVLYFYLFLFLFSVVLSRNNSTYAAYSGNITIFNCCVREYIFSRMYFLSFYPFCRGECQRNRNVYLASVFVRLFFD